MPIARRPQSRAVVVLGFLLAGLLTLWGVGAYLLLTHTPDFGPLPGSTPTPSVTE